MYKYSTMVVYKTPIWFVHVSHDESLDNNTNIPTLYDHMMMNVYIYLYTDDTNETPIFYFLSYIHNIYYFLYEKVAMLSYSLIRKNKCTWPIKAVRKYKYHHTKPWSSSKTCWELRQQMYALQCDSYIIGDLERLEH